MILADTNVWIDHFKNDNKKLREILDTKIVCIHEFILAELACGKLQKRKLILNLLSDLPSTSPLSLEDLLGFIDQNNLFGRGLGLVDIQLLASCQRYDQLLWTYDKKLLREAKRLKIAFTV